MWDRGQPDDARAEARGASRAHRATINRVRYMIKHDTPPPYGGPLVRKVDAEIGRARAEARAEGIRLGEYACMQQNEILRKRVRELEAEVSARKRGQRKR